MIAIIDYVGGNVGSVRNALNSLGISNIITDNKKEISSSDKIILPGQGRFGDVMNKLREKKLDKLLITEIKNGKPYLGICIGLQILFKVGEEDSGIQGFGILKGNVPKFKAKLKIPQIGWNKVALTKKSIFFKDIANNSQFYFVHSYYVEPVKEETVLCKTDYGINFVSGIEKDNIIAVQFHPEKSGRTGLQLLKNFCELI